LAPPTLGSSQAIKTSGLGYWLTSDPEPDGEAKRAAVLRRLPEAGFRSATDAGPAGLHDLEVLALAARDGRLLVTHDKNTMPTRFGEFIAKTASPSVVVVSSGPATHHSARFEGGAEHEVCKIGQYACRKPG
jgi:hypothetical protein